MFRITYLTLPLRAGNLLCNIGDRVIFVGVRNIMRQAIGLHHEQTRHLSDSAPIPGNTDIVVVCGTPQIANMNPVNFKLSRIVDAAQSHIPVKLNLGAGSFYFDAFGSARHEKDATFAACVKKAPVAKSYAEYAGFDLCTCRDFGAAATLRALGIEALSLLCPGFFSAIFQPRPLFRRPEQLVSVLNGTASFWNRVNADVHDFYRRLCDADPSRIFLAHDEQDCLMLVDLNIPYVVFDSAEQFLTYLAASDRLLSLRVHGALPAWTLGLDVTLLGIDRRALLGDHFGAQFRVIPVRNEQDLAIAEALPVRDRPQQDDIVRRAWLRHYLDLYVRNIRDVITRKLGREIPEVVPLHARGGIEPMLPAISAARGKYFRNFFYSANRAFSVDRRLLRSDHSHEYLDDGICIETSSATNTLAFGPYVLVPKGRWRAAAKLRISEIPPNSGGLRENASVSLRIMKGVPGTKLAVREVMIPSDFTTQDMLLEVEFDNVSDTGSIETVFATRDRMPAGTRVYASGRLCCR